MKNPITGNYDIAERDFYDGSNLVLVTDASGHVSNRYLWGLTVSGETPLASDTGGIANVQWYFTDRLGSVTDIVDSQGHLVNHYGYDTFGNVVVNINPDMPMSRFGYDGYTTNNTG